MITCLLICILSALSSHATEFTELIFISTLPYIYKQIMTLKGAWFTEENFSRFKEFVKLIFICIFCYNCRQRMTLRDVWITGKTFRNNMNIVQTGFKVWRPSFEILTWWQLYRRSNCNWTRLRYSPICDIISNGRGEGGMCSLR